MASLAFAFQVFQWLRTWQTRVEVKLQRMSLLSPGQTGEPVVLFRLVNHSGHVVKITHVGMTPIERGGPHLMFPHPLPLPRPGTFEIPARDAVTVYVKPEQLAEGDPRWKTRAQVTTSDDRTFKSKKVRVQELTSDTNARSR